MSFLLGPVSGAVLAGGVYFGFSTMIRTRTEQHIRDLNSLSARLLEPSATANAPVPAFDRIEHKPFLTLLQSRWNVQVESMFRGISDFNGKAAEWSRRKLYGESNGIERGD